MVARWKSIFEAAEAYSQAAHLLNSAANINKRLLIPSQINAALALELYFKSIYFIEYGNDFKINGRHSHDFYKLFTVLSSATRSNITGDFDELLRVRNMRDVLIYESEFNIQIPLDLISTIKDWSTIFTKMRYFYDEKNEVCRMVFFPEMEEILIKVIRKLEIEMKAI